MKDLKGVRILWHGVSPHAPSGYGVATWNILKRLREAGAEIVCMSVYGIHGGRFDWKGIPIWPVKRMQYGGDVIRDYIKEFQPDVVLTLYDQWVMPGFQDLGSIWLPYVVLHYEPMEPKLKQAVDRTWRQFSLCDWATKTMRKEGLHPRTVPLGVDLDTFRPLHGLIDGGGNIIEPGMLKRGLGGKPDDFMVGMVAANRDFRKHLEPQLRVFAEFHRNYPDSRLFIKTNPSGAEGGWDMMELTRKLFDLSADNPEAPVSMPESDQMSMSEATMCQMYNSFDVFLNCSMSEGWGFTPLEANACGVPAIYTDFSAMPEVCYGWKVPCTKVLTRLYAFGGAVDEHALYNTLVEAYEMRGSKKAERMKVEARKHAMKYDWNHVVPNIFVPELGSWLEDREL